MLKQALVIGAIILGFSYYVGKSLLSQDDPPIPTLPETNWGPLDVTEDTSIKPFKIQVSKNVIDDLNERLSRTRDFVPPLEGAAWTYGISTKYFKTVLDYWKKDYNWSKRQDLLNKYPQFVTNIQGLDIHFYHVKPKKIEINGKPLKVLPLLLVHGWPGSIVEFQKIIPLLTAPRPDKDFVFEIVAPSLPGYGFSQAALRPGLATPQMAVIFKNLMVRLGFQKFYTQGGDWGSAITADLAILFPERVIGTHLNMCFVMNPKAYLYQFIGAYFPSFIVEPEHHSKMYPLKHHYARLIEESGYMHIQGSKPDTIGTALSDSPAALAAYILEKFSTWTNPEYRFREDGGLLEKYNLDELLDNIMVYWVTNSITTSVRLYAESFNPEVMAKFQTLTSHVPTACAIFPYELVYVPEIIAKLRFKNLIQFNHLSRGGHFAAFEEPKILADDVFIFVNNIEKKIYLNKNEKKSKTN